MVAASAPVGSGHRTLWRAYRLHPGAGQQAQVDSMIERHAAGKKPSQPRGHARGRRFTPAVARRGSHDSSD